MRFCMRNECAKECAERSNNGIIAKDYGDRYVTGEAWLGCEERTAVSMPIGDSGLLYLAKAREGTGFSNCLLRLHLTENCIYISAEREVRDSRQSLVP